METSELLKKVRRIEIKTRGLSRNIFAGQYHSAFKGRGMAFSEVREYQYGDDIRDIDWNVTARYVRPYVKVFEEERELTVMLLIDVSGSRDFGSVNVMKKEVITEIAATLAFSAIQNNDKIGVVFFSDKIEKFIPPQKGKKHILYVIRELIDFQPDKKQTNIAQTLKYLTNATEEGQEKNTQGDEKARRLHHVQAYPAGEKHRQPHGHHRRGDEPHHRRAQAGHAPLDDGAGPELGEAPGHQQNDEKRGEDHPQGGASRPQRSPGHHTHVGGDVDRKGPGSAFAHRYKIHQLSVRHPAVACHFRLNEGQHGVAAPKGEGANLKKGPKQFPENHTCFLPTMAE